MVNFVLDNILLAEQESLVKNLLTGLPKELGSAEVLAEWEKRVALAVVYTKPHFAYKMLVQLRQLLAQQNAAVKLKYKEVVSWLYMAAMIDLAKEDLISFFKEADLGVVLSDEGYGDLVPSVKGRLALEEAMADRDAYREQIYNALHENQNKLSAQSSRPTEPGTVANWLKIYDGLLGLSPAEILALTQFVSRVAIEAKLNEQEKNILRHFLEFYEFIKLSSYDARAFEEDIIYTDEKGNTYLLADGQQIDLDEVESEIKRAGPAAPLPATPAALQTKTESKVETLPTKEMPAFPLVVVEARKLLTITQGQTSAVLPALSKAISEQRTNEALGALLLLAQLRSLDDVLAAEQTFRSWVTADLRQSGQEAQLPGLQANPTAPQFLSRFLKVVLQDKLRLSAAEALAFGKKLGGLLILEGEKYGRMVISGSAGELKWNL